jgi:hypothetical protein
MSSKTITPKVRKLGEEKFFAQSSSTKAAKEVKALIVPHKNSKGENTTIISVSQDSDFVLLAPETIQAILNWYNRES